MNKVFKSAILLFVVASFLGCSDLSNPVSTDEGGSSDESTTICEDCTGNAQLLAIVPTTTTFEISANQIVQTISGRCNDGQFPRSYLVWEMTDDNTGALIKTSANAAVYVGGTEFVNGQSIDGLYFCTQGRFRMDVEMPYVTSLTGLGGLALPNANAGTFTVRVSIFGLDANSQSHPASTSRNYKLIPRG